MSPGGGQDTPAELNVLHTSTAFTEWDPWPIASGPGAQQFLIDQQQHFDHNDYSTEPCDARAEEETMYHYPKESTSASKDKGHPVFFDI